MLYYDLNPSILAFTTDRTVGRDPQLIKQALKASSASDGVEAALLYPHQIHSDRVMQISDDFFSLPAATQKILLEGVDAVVSQARNVIIGVSTADCIPVLVYDPAHHAAAAIHAGWRGTVLRIVQKAIDEMHIAFGTNPADCKAVIGPGISMDSFEVGDEVYASFVGSRLLPNASYGEDANERLAKIYPASMAPTEEGRSAGVDKWHINLKEVNRNQLLLAGVKHDNITVSDIDTFTDEHYFSARREQKGTEKCGRNLTAFMLR